MTLTLRRGAGPAARRLATGLLAAGLLAIGVLAAGLSGAGTALAQQRPTAPATPPPATPSAGPEAGPERTTAQFGEWAVQCVALAQGRRICEMAQTVQDSQRNQPIAVIAIGRMAKDQPLRLAVRVPVNVLVTQPAQLLLDGGGAPVPLGFTRCSIVPVGCFAERELQDDLLRRLRSRPAEQAGRIAWREATGQETAIPITFRGFAAAYEALLKEGG